MVEKRDKLKRAKEDITCYKYVLKACNELFTPYMGVIVSIGNTYHSDITREEDNIEQALHSFSCKEDVMESFGFKINIVCENNPLIVKCTIPKNSLYYKGKFCGWDGYASDCIRYDEIIENGTENNT